MEIIKKIIKGINKDYLKNSDDYVLVIDGREGSGKSTLLLNIIDLHEGDNPDIIDRICFTGIEFLKALKEAKAGQIVAFDEAEEGMYSKEGMMKLNIIIDKALMVSRAKSIFVILCIPSFFVINKYIRLLRLGMLLHCVKPRGTVMAYTHHNNQITKLVMDGQKYFNYNVAFPTFRDDFPKYTGKLWKPYMAKKMKFIDTFLGNAYKTKTYSLNAVSKILNVSRGFLKKKVDEGKIFVEKNKAGSYIITQGELNRIKKTKL